jgi:hypothetical protein
LQVNYEPIWVKPVCFVPCRYISFDRANCDQFAGSAFVWESSKYPVTKQEKQRNFTGTCKTGIPQIKKCCRNYAHRRLKLILRLIHFRSTVPPAGMSRFAVEDTTLPVAPLDFYCLKGRTCPVKPLQAFLYGFIFFYLTVCCC